jgi:hypothetical protein
MICNENMNLSNETMDIITQLVISTIKDIYISLIVVIREENMDENVSANVVHRSIQIF